VSPIPVHTRQVLVATQVVFFACVAASTLVAYGPDAEEYGISYYGVHASTIPLIVIGYGVASLGLWRTASQLARLEPAPVVVPVLRTVAIALPLELLTPFNHGAFFNWAHMFVGIAIGVSQMASGIFVMLRQRGRAATIACVVQLVGGIVAALSLPDWGFNHMLEGEMIFEVGYSWSLILWTRLAPARSSLYARL
jgi:hypothetical protein